MQRDPLLYGVIGVLIGGIVVWFLASSAINNNMSGMMRMMGMRPRVESSVPMMGEQKEEEESPAHHMEEMMEPLKGKEGEEFDRQFLNLMIIHHQGAIDMAEDAKDRGKREELKRMADDIISAQTKEIQMMKDWQKDGGINF